MAGYRGSDPLEAIRVDGTTVTTIPGLAGTAGDVAYDIDDAGTTVVGASFLSNGESRGWTNDGTETTQLESFGSTYEIASRINNAGVIAGSARDGSGQMHLVAWQGGAIADIGGGAYSSANVSDINEAGHVLASVTVPPNDNRAILWDGSTAINLGLLPGGDWTSAGAMNESGGVVVSAKNSAGKFRAARWDGTSLVDLGALPGGDESFATGINEQGQITGVSYVAPGKTHGFLIDDGVMYDVNDLLPAHSVEVINAQAISDSGHILAYGTNSQPILLVPGARPTADFAVVDLGDGLATQHSDGFPGDLNSARQATGSIRLPRLPLRRDDIREHLPDVQRVARPGDQRIRHRRWHCGSRRGPAGFSYDGTVDFLGTLGGARSFAQDINDAGDIVGSADTSGGQQHAFVYRDGVMTDLHTLGGTTSIATDINAPGTVVGNYSPTSGTFRGFVSDGTTTTDLGTLGGGFTAPSAINGSDVIVGTSSTPSQSEPRLPLCRWRDDQHRAARLDQQRRDRHQRDGGHRRVVSRRLRQPPGVQARRWHLRSHPSLWRHLRHVH